MIVEAEFDPRDVLAVLGWTLSMSQFYPTNDLTETNPDAALVFFLNAGNNEFLLRGNGLPQPHVKFTAVARDQHRLAHKFRAARKMSPNTVDSDIGVPGGIELPELGDAVAQYANRCFYANQPFVVIFNARLSGKCEIGACIDLQRHPDGENEYADLVAETKYFSRAASKALEPTS